MPHGIPASEPGWGTPADVARGRATTSTGPLFLYPAITYPHKNHVTLVRAFAELRTSHPDLVLVLTGGPARRRRSLAHEISRLGLTDAVRRTAGSRGRPQLACTTRRRCTVFPSRYEGFGLPVLEAMGAVAR